MNAMGHDAEVAEQSGLIVYAGIRRRRGKELTNPLHLIDILAEVRLNERAAFSRGLAGVFHQLGRARGGESRRKNVTEAPAVPAVPLFKKTNTCCNRSFRSFQHRRRDISIHHDLANE